MPYTPKDYALEQNKDAKRSAFTQAFKPRQHRYSHGQVLMDCPLTTDLGMEQLISSSQAMLAPYENKPVRFLALGCTPLRLLQTASFLPGAEGKEFGYAAFSGRYVSINTQVPGNLEFKGAPSPAQLKAYRAYLRGMGLNPQDIVKNHNAQNPLVIVEAIMRGGGLLSFLFLLNQWANELGGADLANQLRKCVHVHVLMDDTVQYHDCLIKPDLYAFMGFPLTQQSVPNNLLGYLFESKEAFDDSLGQSYPVSAWLNRHPPAMGQQVSRNSELLSFHILDHLATHPELLHTPNPASSQGLRSRFAGRQNYQVLARDEEEQEVLTCCQQLARMFGFRN